MSSQKSKKKTKAPQGRPTSTAAISQPTVEDSSQLTSLSSFSPDGNHFAFLSLAVDKHRLRVYSTVSGQSVAEHILENARVSAVAWGSFTASAGPASTPTDGLPSKKKRRRKESTSADP
jgi:U3 small nucleolar RNA-associated protein 5